MYFLKNVILFLGKLDVFFLNMLKITFKSITLLLAKFIEIFHLQGVSEWPP